MSDSDAPSPQVISVVLDNSLPKPLDYLVPVGWTDLKVGMRVQVPVRKGLQEGTVIELVQKPSLYKLLYAHKILTENTVLEGERLELALWMKKYYCSPWHKVLKVFLPASMREEKEAPTEKWIKLAKPFPEIAALCQDLRNKFPMQAEILSLLLENPDGLPLNALIKKAKSSKSPIDTLLRKKILTTIQLERNRSSLEEFEFFATQPKKLSEEQSQALQTILKDLHHKRFQTHLLFGVTGSGKTEVYLQAIAAARAQELSVIMLVPEIALTSQMIERLKGRFQEKVAILHHRLSAQERNQMWQQLQKGEIKVAIGARSAVFAPVVNLGLIIVDEEHEGSYKQQDEMPCYHARDVAIMRGKLSGCPVVLGSATPSLETFHRASLKNYTMSSLTMRAAHASPPQVTIIDMKKEYEKRNGFTLFSNALLQGIKERLQKGEQSLLFLNRRGFHSTLLCSACGEVAKCASCDVSLTHHQKDNCLVCHACGFTLLPPPKKCLYCHAEATLSYKGFGTEQVESQLQKIFPGIRTLRMDADTTRLKGSHERHLKHFRSGKADVLIGTQMIAKGLHFSSVTLVGILNPDSALHIPDFRAAETTFQIVTQVAGRSGRGSLMGEVILQTLMPSHPIYQEASKEDYLTFYQRESAVRKEFLYPPFNRLVKWLFTGEKEEKVRKSAEEFRLKLASHLSPDTLILPVSPALQAKIKNRYRFLFLIKLSRPQPFEAILESVFKEFSLPYDVRLLIDIDTLETTN